MVNGLFTCFCADTANNCYLLASEKQQYWNLKKKNDKQNRQVQLSRDSESRNNQAAKRRNRLLFSPSFKISFEQKVLHFLNLIFVFCCRTLLGTGRSRRQRGRHLWRVKPFGLTFAGKRRLKAKRRLRNFEENPRTNVPFNPTEVICTNTRKTSINF